MVYDGIEKKILERMCQNLVVRKSELIQFVRDDTKNPRDMVDVVTKSLITKGLIISVYASETTFAVTQRGMKHMK